MTSTQPHGASKGPIPHNGDPHTILVYAPATGQLMGEVPAMGPGEVKARVARARYAQETWRRLSVEERCERLLVFRDALMERAEDLVETLCRETGKPRQEALLFEIMVWVDMTTWYCKHAPSILASREVSLHLLKHRRSFVHYVPRGVIGVISPWNFPFVIPMGDVIAGLITGSAVVVKPSEIAPLTVLKAKEIWDQTGSPNDVFQVITGYGETGAAMIDAGIQKLIFTGGVATGKRVAAACGERLIPCVMELGGKAPLIACADADIERTARAIVFGGFAHSGQACISVERVYAHNAIHDKLLQRVVQLVRELRQGDPLAGTVDVGAMTFAKQIEVAEHHIQDAVKKGAEVKTGGYRLSGPGSFFAPTVLAGCHHGMTVMKEEIFGPIVPFMEVQNEEEAIELANDSHLGLNAYIFTSDRAHGRKLAERVEAGSVLVNDVFSNYSSEAPFGGIKQSGFGRVHGEDALRDMADVRHVSVDRIASLSRDPFWYPYSDKSYAWFLKGTRALFSRKGIFKMFSNT